MRLKFFKNPTPQSISKAALKYMERYAASEKSLRTVLRNRVKRACLRNETFAKDTTAQQALHDKIEEIILKYKKSGILNDEVYAQNKAAQLRRKGKSGSIIVHSLQEKGIKKEAVIEALRAYDASLGYECSEEAEFSTAMLFAKRKKFDTKAKSLLNELEEPDSNTKEQLREKYKDLKRKALASMARGGYSSVIARRVINEIF